MPEWVLIVLISIGLLLVIFSIIFISRYLEKSKLEKAHQIVLQQEEEERQRKQKVIEEIEAKVKAIADRRAEIKRQFEWLEDINKKIKERWD